MEAFKNPIIIGLCATGILYLYMQWRNTKKYLDNPENRKPASMFIPIVFGVFVFICLSLLHNKKILSFRDTLIQLPLNLESPPVENMQLGSALPRVFLETF